MRRPRLKPESSIFHCISRVVGNAWLLRLREKEVLRRQMWAVAEYCGVRILTYAFMSNHYHIVVLVPPREDVSDAELLRRYRVLYPHLKPHQERRLEAVIADMKVGGSLAAKWRQQQMRQMFDVSEFQKLLKMRFSIWYNKTHQRFGTLWSDRFKSTIAQDGEAAQTMSAYVDLNSVRAHIVADPKDYRFCGYAEAVAGNARAQAGLCELYGADWEETSKRYRCLLFGTISDMRETKAPLSPDEFREVVKTGGRLALHEVLRCRIRYFADGVVLGSEEFVRERASRLPGTKPRTPRPLAQVTNWNGLHILTRMRGNVWG